MEQHASIPPRLARWWLVTFAAALGLYAATLAPGLVWQDSADYQWRIALGDWHGPYELARAHVVFIALARGLHLLTGISPALAGNIASALAGAVAIANVLVIARLLGASRLAATAATAALALSHTFWQLATMTETYTLVGALMSAEILCLAFFARTGRTALIPLCGFLNGLGISNHGLALISLASYLTIGVVVLRKRIRNHLPLVAATLGCWLIGLLPILIVMAHQVLAGDMTVTDTLRDWLVGRYYARNVFNFNVGARTVFLALAMIGLSFPSAALFLVPAGTRPLYQRNPRWLASVPVILFAAHLLFAARYDIVDQYTFFIPTYVAMSLLLAPGVDRLLQARGVWRQLRWPLIVTLFWSPLAYAVLPSVVPWIAARVALPIPTRRVPNRDPLRWFLQPWHTGYDGPERFVREALPTLPDDAVLLIDLTQAGPLYYGQCVFGLNPGVQINHWRCLGAPQPIDATNVARWVAEGRLFTGSADQSCMAQAEDVWVLEAYALERAGYFYRVVNKANDSERAPGGPR